MLARTFRSKVFFAIVGYTFLQLFAFSPIPLTSGVQVAEAQTETIEYLTVPRKKRKKLRINNCSLFAAEDGNLTEVDRVLITKRGRIYLPRSNNRKSYRTLKALRSNTFWGCGDNGSGEDSIFTKETIDGIVSEIDLSESDFPKRATGSVGKECRSVKGFPGSFIYKTIGSSHFPSGDVRRYTVGLIIKPGVRGPFPSCISLIDKNGKTATKLGLYQTGNGWSARYYAGIGCGGGTAHNGSKVASTAKKNSGSSQVYVDFGSTCFGPFEPSRCIGSTQC